MSWLKALATQIRGLLQVFQSYLRCMAVEVLPQPNVSNQPVKSGQTMLDAPTQSKPVRQTYKRKLSAAQADTKGQSLKRIQKPAPLEHIQDGSQQATPVRPSSQSKRKRLVVQLIKVAKSPNKEAPQPQVKAPRGKQSATLVSKTPQHAKQAKKPKL